ncbi:DUF3040 domain-containing protein [Nonomuraea sp. NPDC000554]|uniref:DUF3040 domain-containing protein n=1 Tax=Nonomuraea sp. NPDC000554 TaxID=3154259 RepID=UPI0033269833
MALSARERSVLDGVARQVRAEDPTLAQDLSEHGSGAVTSERIPSLWEAWPVALVAVALVAFALTLLLTGSPETLPHPVIR